MTLRSLQAVPELRAVPDLDEHEVIDLGTRERRPCPLPGEHAVAAMPERDHITCRNPLPLAMRRASRSITCYAQVPLDEQGRLPGLCPRCRGVLDPYRVIGAE